MNRSKSGNGLLVTLLLIIALLPAAYMGTYYAMLVGVDRGGPGWIRFPPFEPTYRIQSPLVEQFFLPAHKVDRWLWPKRWYEV